MIYAGTICGKCRQGCNGDRPIIFLDELYKQQRKRYKYICSDCITDIAGGWRELKKLQSKQILTEMGL